MTVTTLLQLTLPAPPRDPVAAALESFRQVASCRATLRSHTGDSTEVIRPHNGAVLVYYPERKEARLRPIVSQAAGTDASPG